MLPIYCFGPALAAAIGYAKRSSLQGISAKLPPSLELLHPSRQDPGTCTNLDARQNQYQLGQYIFHHIWKSGIEHTNEDLSFELQHPH